MYLYVLKCHWILHGTFHQQQKSDTLMYKYTTHLSRSKRMQLNTCKIFWMRFMPSNLSGVLSEVFSSQRSPDEPINICHFFGARGAGHNRQCEVRMVCWVLGCPGDNSDGTTRDSSSLQLLRPQKFTFSALILQETRTFLVSL